MATHTQKSGSETAIQTQDSLGGKKSDTEGYNGRTYNRKDFVGAVTGHWRNDFRLICHHRDSLQRPLQRALHQRDSMSGLAANRACRLRRRLTLLMASAAMLRRVDRGNPCKCRNPQNGQHDQNRYCFSSHVSMRLRAGNLQSQFFRKSLANLLRQPVVHVACSNSCRIDDGHRSRSRHRHRQPD